MMQLGLLGGGFHHAYSSTLLKHPKYFSWAKGSIKDITCFAEEQIVPNIDNHSNIKKFAWVIESSVIIPGVIDNVIKNYKEISESYEFLISHDKRITSLASNFYYLPPHGYWIKTPQIYPKTKMCSMISSAKRMCSGHDFRLNWVDKLKDSLDLFGSGIRNFENKEEAVSDYLFSVTIENSQYETYWTEKILDCFASGTIPIYHGAQDISEFFNMDGIILLDDNFNVSQLSEELYLSKESAILDNFERSLKYDVIEDIMFEKFISKML